jgi:hypothetical protein
MAASFLPSAIIASWVVAATSALIGPGDQVADLGDHLQHRTARLGDQGRVGGDAVHQAGGGQVGDDLGVGAVEEDLHPF